MLFSWDFDVPPFGDVAFAEYVLPHCNDRAVVFEPHSVIESCGDSHDVLPAETLLDPSSLSPTANDRTVRF